MNRLLTAVALAAVLGSPALAQQRLWSGDTAEPHSSVRTYGYGRLPSDYDTQDYRTRPGSGRPARSSRDRW